MSDVSPLITHLYTADPSTHVFNSELYIYPSHDRETSIQDNDNGDQYDMTDYHVFSMSRSSGPVTDHGITLHADDVPWVSKQMWAPDAATKDGKFFLYFPAGDKTGVFRIGVATAEKPEGPFVPRERWIDGSYSIDPACFVDEDGAAYLYFDGIWGGQLQCWQREGVFDDEWSGPKEVTGEGMKAMGPRVARLRDDMLEFAETPKEALILDDNGKPLLADYHERRFFEAAWTHKYGGKYYFSYSTGDTHFLAYAIGDSPYGPFTFRGHLLDPVVG